MNKKKLIIGGAVLVLVSAVTGAVWLSGVGPFKTNDTEASEKVSPVQKKHGLNIEDARFVTLDKFIVMLNTPNATRARYLAIELVFVTNDKNLKRVKDQLPLLRSTAYRTLAAYNVEQVRGMNVDQLAAVLSQSYQDIYGGTSAMPFSEVHIANQMLE